MSIEKISVDSSRSLIPILKENQHWRDFAASVDEVSRSLLDNGIWQLTKMRDPDSYHIGDTVVTEHGTGVISKIHDTVGNDIDWSTNIDLTYANITVTYEKPIFSRRYSLKGKFSIGDSITTVDGDGWVLNVVSYDYNTSTSLIDVNFSVGITDLKYIHDIHSAKRWLVLNSKTIGFDYFSTKLSQMDYYRIMKFASMYWPDNGTSDFVNFIGFLLDAKLGIEQLWTQDYQLFTRESIQKIAVWQGGDWYPTSQVNVQYDVLQSPKLDTRILTELFYRIAPVNLVLERISGFPISFGKVSIGPKFEAYCSMHEYGVCK